MRATQLLSVCLVSFVLISLAQADDLPRTISVSGRGKASAPPNMASIQTGVVTQSAQASSALAANNQAMERLLGVLKQQGIAEKDVQTSNFSIQPERKRDNRNRPLAEIAGYRVTNQVRVIVRNLPNLGKVLDGLVSAGSNQVSGVSFGIDDPTGVMDQARNKAIAEARRRAELYAHAAGVEVGKVISISEQGSPTGRAQFVGRAMAMESSVPIATGEQEVVATVNLVFELDD